MQQPTGLDFQRLEDFSDLQNTINLRCFFSGDLNGVSGLATRNIKFLSVFLLSIIFFSEVSDKIYPIPVKGFLDPFRYQIPPDLKIMFISYFDCPTKIEIKIEDKKLYRNMNKKLYVAVLKIK
mgnify:CR=1 FL=1